MDRKIVLATRNEGKIGEIRRMLESSGFELFDARDFPAFPEPPEEGETFFENALAKAKAVHAATGLPALADDSGIEVDALGGGPGVHSARFGGAGLSDRDRCTLLLEKLADLPDGERGARFVCVMVLYPAPGEAADALVTEGYFYGRIAREPAGENGFGYDPVFFLPERGMTVAQMTPDEKNATSHRYRALLEMKLLLEYRYREEDPATKESKDRA